MDCNIEFDSTSQSCVDMLLQLKAAWFLTEVDNDVLGDDLVRQGALMANVRAAEECTNWD